MRKDTFINLLFFAVFAYIPFILFSCVSKTREDVGCKSEYYYRTNNNISFEDNIIELRYDEGKLVDGYFWGTSDEFDSGREGYRPGATVLQMKDLKIKDDTISFMLDSQGQIFFSNAIDVDIHSCEEALKKGYRVWIETPDTIVDSPHSPFYGKVSYKGRMYNDAIEIDYAEENSSCSFVDIRYFVRKSLEEIKVIDRRLPEERDIANSVLYYGKMSELLDSLMNIDYEENGLITYYEFPTSGANSISNDYFCGFDVDEDGQMYFAGGTPLQVACFNGNGKNLIYRRVIEDNLTRMDLFHTRHDSIYIIDENKNELMRMHKDGSGDVVRMKLKDDKIRQCQFKDDCFLAFKEEEKEDVIIGSGESMKNKWNQKTYDYGGNLLDERTIEISFCYLDMLVRSAPVKESVKEDKDDMLWYYKEGKLRYYKDYRGRYKGLYLHWCAYIVENGMYYEMQLTDKDGNVKYRYKISEDAIPGGPMSVGCKEFACLHFPRYEIIRNNKFYLVRFIDETQNAVVTCIDLEVAFPDL